MSTYTMILKALVKSLLIAVIIVSVAQPVALAAPYTENWDSLSKHQIPEWFKDAKFGIYAHWGVYSVPAYGNEWYPRNMYRDGDNTFKHHKETWGDQSKFGYKDFVPMFKAEKFDAEKWAEIYQRAGAKFAGPVAEHHDGFSMWASKVNRWNVGDMGPKRDITGELIEALRKRGIKIVTSFHHAFNIQGYYTAKEGWDTVDPKYADLYGFPGMEDRTLAHDRWFGKLKEVIDRYQPDQIWFDFGLGKIPDQYKLKMTAYYYNKADDWGKEVVITRKDNYLPEGVGVLDIERGRMKDMGKELWQTDDSDARNSWCWVHNLDVKPAEEMIHELIDIVSKNGVLLLNVCPKADGTIDDDQQIMLREMGDWLKVNGEAIYATRPWETFGEGPTRLAKGGGFLDAITYTARDVRYTRSKDGKTLYAILMGWPKEDVTLQSVKINRAGGNAKVELIGHNTSLTYSVNKKGQPVIKMSALSSDQRPCEYAYVLKVSGFDFKASSEVAFMTGDAVSLLADKAVLDGDKINSEKKNGRTNIGFWDNPKENIHWLLRLRNPGTYSVRGEFTAANGPTKLTLTVAGKEVSFKVPKTDGWEKPEFVDMGQIKFDASGIYHVVLKPTDLKSWKAINVWQIQFARMLD